MRLEESKKNVKPGRRKDTLAYPENPFWEKTEVKVGSKMIKVSGALRKFSGPREFASLIFENQEITKPSLGTFAKFLYAHLCIAEQCVLNAGRQVE